MTDAVAEEVIAEAYRQLNKPYVLGAEGPHKFDCSGLMWWIFNQTGNGALIGGSRKLAAGYARWFSNAGKYSRSQSAAQRGDLICYAKGGQGTRVSHIGIYLGNGKAISALVPPYGVRVHSAFGLSTPFDGVCLVDYPSDPGRTGPDTTPSEDDDPEDSDVWSEPRWLGDIQILYQGVDITANVEFRSARFLSQAGGAPGEAALRVKDEPHLYAPGYFHTGGTLELYVNGSREWDGWVINVNREYAFPVDNTETPSATPRYWALEGYDRNFLFSRRFHLDKAAPANTDFGIYPAGAVDRDVVLDILANYTTLDDDGLDITSGITEVGPIDPYEEVKVVGAGQMWGESARKLVLFNGGLMYIDPDRIVRYVDDTTVTAPFALSDEPDVGEIGYREVRIRYDAAQLWNDALIWGTGIGSPEPVFARVTSEDSINDHGRFQYGELVRTMYRQESVDRRADVLVNGSPSHQRGHKDDALRIECVLFQPGLRVGYGVSFHCGAWDFGDLYYDPADIVDPPPTPPGANEFERLLFQIGKIESNNTYTRQNRRSFAYGRWQVMPGNWRVWGPLALGLPRSVGVAARDIPPENWYPPPTPANQDTVVRWRMGAMYRNMGDPRRVAAAWRSGVSVAQRDPSQWSRGTLLYVNHATVPLGYPPTTNETVLTPITNPDESREDYQVSVSADDVYPVRKMEITFPTPNSVRYAVVLSHTLDVPWAFDDPIPPVPPPGDDDAPHTEVFTLIPPGTAYTPPSEGGDPPTDWLGSDFSISARGMARRGHYGHSQYVYPPGYWHWIDEGAGETTDEWGTFFISAPGIYSSVGIGHGFASSIPAASSDNRGCSPNAAWTEWEDSELWYRCDVNLVAGRNIVEANQQYPLELRMGNRTFMGHVSAIRVGVSPVGPNSSGYGASSTIGYLQNNNNTIAYPADWPTRYGQPLMEGDFGSVIIPRGTLTPDCWITLSPAWSCQRMTWPAMFCDPASQGRWGNDATAAACANRGPRCTGEGNSGVFTLAGPRTLTLTAVGVGERGYGDDTTTDAIGATTSTTTWVNGQYRTLYPYIEGTLEITYEGVKLTRGIDYEETDPGNGLFTLIGTMLGKAGEIVVKYWSPTGAVPTSPQPGEPPPGTDVPDTTGSSAVEAVIARAWAMIGTPYQLGAESLSQVDCSGLIYRIFMDAGYGYLVGNSRKRASPYTKYFADRGYFTRDLSQARRGDLISYVGDGPRPVGHIGIYLGDGRVISALVNPWGVTAHKTLGIGAPVYGVCLVPYPKTATRTSAEASDAEEDDTEDERTPTEDLPPQTPTTSSGRVYRPDPQSQFGWGTAYDGMNSLMAAAAMAVDRQTLGVHSPDTGSPLATPPNMRTYSGKTGATTLTDAKTAWTAGWQETLELGPVTWEAFKAKIAEGRGAIVEGTVASLPEAYRVRDWPDAHAVYVNEITSDGSYWVVDPLGRAAALWPQSVMRGYAISLSGTETVSCAFTRRTSTF